MNTDLELTVTIKPSNDFTARILGCAPMATKQTNSGLADFLTECANHFDSAPDRTIKDDENYARYVQRAEELAESLRASVRMLTNIR